MLKPRGSPVLFSVTPPPDLESLPKCPDCGDVERVECGCCGSYHLPDYAGDCRNDAERFSSQCACDDEDDRIYPPRTGD